MLTYDDALNLNFYNKSSYTGWMNPIRFLIKKEKPEDGDPFFHAWVWPGPYIFEATDDSKKLEYTAPFSEQGKIEIVDWINAQYEAHKGDWSTKIL